MGAVWLVRGFGTPPVALLPAPTPFSSSGMESGINTVADVLRRLLGEATALGLQHTIQRIGWNQHPI